MKFKIVIFRRIFFCLYAEHNCQNMAPVTLLCSFILLLVMGVSVNAARRPNIVWIMSDDLGYGELSSFGQTNFRTPNIDRLAAEGIRFTSAYCGEAVCAPSRGSLMTGLHMGHAYIRGNGNKGPDGTDTPLRANDTTVAELLQEAGYHTGLVGKWGLGSNASTGSAQLKGFSYFFGEPSQGNAHNMYPEYLFESSATDPRVLDVVTLSGNLRSARGESPSREQCMGPMDDWGNFGGCNYTHDLFTQHAVQYLRESVTERPGQPFFLYVAWTDPHAGGWGSNAETGNPVTFDGEFAENTTWPVVERDHASVIQNVQDRDVGVLLDLLKELGIDEDTIVFYASDNGASDEGGHQASFFTSSGPLRGVKRSLYEGGIRTPSSVRWPGRIVPGLVSDFPWQFADFLPTALDLAGRPDLVPPGVDGLSIVPTLLGGAQGQQRRPADECFYWEFCTNDKWGRAGRMGRWKAVALSSEAPTELYDLETDIGETADLAAQHPEVVRRLEECMDRAHTDSPDWPVGDGICVTS